MDFFFNDTATTEIYTLSLHDALPISSSTSATASPACSRWRATTIPPSSSPIRARRRASARSEEHTSELQSRQYLVCRLLLEKKKEHHMSESPTFPSIVTPLDPLHLLR